MQTLTVGLMADPGLPDKVAHSVAEELPRTLSEHSGPDVTWEVEVNQETLPLTADGEIPLLDHADRLRDEHGWDYVVYLTDLPRSYDGDPLLCEVSSASAAAMISLPGLGAGRFARKICRLLVALLRSIWDGTETYLEPEAVHQALGRTAVRRVTPEGDSSYILLPGRINRVRLLIGMVLSNRPGRLLPALASSVAAAAATGAFGIFYTSIWNMADALPAPRLALISVVVTGALSGWLIFHNSLWSRPRDADAPWRAVADNASTVITVWLSVALMYVILWSVLFLVGLAVIEAGYLQTQLGRPVSVLDYVQLSWLASSLGTLAGALGSNFDSDEAIREATYSRREHQRRQLADTYDD
ncbi:hypothetical protein [Kocuria kalidii]|uniref:hypothetical protein n=1 Tax=Kocuria kalidii TaxID=3376283 RepID=UPI0037A49F5A